MAALEKLGMESELAKEVATNNYRLEDELVREFFDGDLKNLIRDNMDTNFALYHMRNRLVGTQITTEQLAAVLFSNAIHCREGVDFFPIETNIFNL